MTISSSIFMAKNKNKNKNKMTKHLHPPKVVLVTLLAPMVHKKFYHLQTNVTLS